MFRESALEAFAVKINKFRKNYVTILWHAIGQWRVFLVWKQWHSHDAEVLNLEDEKHTPFPSIGDKKNTISHSLVQTYEQAHVIMHSHTEIRPFWGK